MTLLDWTVQVVDAYVSHNPVPPGELPGLIASVHRALADAGATQNGSAKLEPAVPVKKSVAPDHISCLECGKEFSMLKRHIFNDHGLTPEQYRGKWGLPYDYPIVAPNYAQVRSGLAKKIGLGRGRKQGD